LDRRRFLRGLVAPLCVDDKAVPLAWVPEIRVILRRIAGVFGLGPEGAHTRAATPAGARQAKGSTRGLRDAPSRDTERDDWITVTRRLRPSSPRCEVSHRHLISPTNEASVFFAVCALGLGVLAYVVWLKWSLRQSTRRFRRH
jgi:hypothetical protein